MRFRRALAVLALSLGGLIGPLQAGAFGGEPPQPTPPPDEPDVTVVDNEFIPEKRNVSDCISGVQKPDCGSKAKGGWRQTAIFVLIVTAMALGGWRLAVAIRRRDRELAAAAEADAGSSPRSTSNS